MNDPKIPMNSKVSVIIVGVALSGRMIETNVRSGPAPTSRAPSMSESSIAWRPAPRINTAKGIVVHTSVSTIPVALYTRGGNRSMPIR